MELSPGCNTKPGHWHSHEEEHLYALSGSAVLHLGTGRHQLDAGSYVCFPAGQSLPHHLENIGPQAFVTSCSVRGSPSTRSAILTVQSESSRSVAYHRAAR